MNVKNKILAACLMALIAEATAQVPVDGIHYQVGQNGIGDSSLPAPGIYLRDNNWFYYGTGGGLQNYKTFEYVQSPQLMWITDWKILGANLGMDLEIPIINRQASYNIPASGQAISVSQENFGLGDIKLEPLLLSWRQEHFDVTAGYALWVPSGEYSAESIANLGDDEWSHMLTLGGIWYPDKKKSWAISILHHYEFNSSQVGAVSSGGRGFLTHQKVLCSSYTLEWSVSKVVLTNMNLGFFGYYQKQFTSSSQAVNVFSDSEVAGIGPEIEAKIPSWDLAASLRYGYEFEAYHRPQGHVVTFSIAKKF